MAEKKKKANVRGIVAAAASLIVVGGFVAGFFALRNALTSKYSVDKEAEQQKCFFVGTFVDDDYPIHVHVSLISPDGSLRDRTLQKKDFNYNTSGQQSTETVWCDLASFAAEATGGKRIDDWIEQGGQILFDATQNGQTSETKDCSWGGGAYLVHNPDGKMEITVEYVPVTVYIAEDYVL